MTKVYLLYSVAETNDCTLEAVVTDKSVAERWAAHWGNHYDERDLDDLRVIAWAIKD